MILGTGAREDTLAALRAQLGLDRPPMERYLVWVGGLVRTALSDYRKLRAALGLATYDEAAMAAKLAAAGFRAERAQKNIGHNPARMTFLARPI